MTKNPTRQLQSRAGKESNAYLAVKDPFSCPKACESSLPLKKTIKQKIMEVNWNGKFF